jgi:hypothetical protein
MPPNKSTVDQFFAAYVKLGGAHDRETFGKNLTKFFELTMDAYINRIESRTKAWNAWVDHIGSDTEANLYFNGVDSVHAYT